MSRHHGMLARSKAIRPRVLKLARQGRLVDECFKESQRMVYPAARQVFQADERQGIAVERQEGLKVAVHLARQDRHGLRIKLGRSQHAGQRVEVRMFVGQDNG